MVKSAREIACAGITVALLIGGQYALSMISGIEIVTAIFALYCLVFGAISGVIVAVAFSLIRCFVFGFFPQVIILYLIYYVSFALVVGLLSKVLKDRQKWLTMIVLTVVCAILTVGFTAIDNLLNIVFFGVSGDAIKIYILQSLPVLFRQVVCVCVTIPLLFYPLGKVFQLAKTK